MIDEELLNILRCPITKTRLTVADQELVDRVNKRIEQEKIENCIGEKVTRAVDGGLINESQAHLLPIFDGIPCLIPDEAIPLAQITD